MAELQPHESGAPRTGQDSSPYVQLHALMNTAGADPADCFAVGQLTALVPLTVQMGEQIYYGEEIVLARQLTERTEEVTPVGWETDPQTCTASHAHTIPEKRVQLIVHSPLRVGQRLLLLPRLDQQMIYVVDILP